MPERRRVVLGAKTQERLVMGLAVAVCLLTIALSISLSLGTGEYSSTDSLLWEEARQDAESPKEDHDHDGIPSIDENYVYGTNIYDPDTDGDGMDDFWEVQWFDVRDPMTEEPIIDPNDPSDAYQDPDGDGYDLNRNGRIDRYDDAVTPTRLNIPVDKDYRPMSVTRVLQNPALYKNEAVLLQGVYVMDNGSLATDGPRIERETFIRVAEDRDSPSVDWVRIIIRPYASRPVDLRAVDPAAYPASSPADRVDVQGVLRVVGPAVWIEVRGGEEFTNIMEYRARFATSVPNPADPLLSYNLLDPTNPDTDGDGMCDGWEAYYGDGYVDPATGDFTWIWRIDPTDPTDAMEDLDGDGVDVRWDLVRWLWVDMDGDGVYEPPGGAAPFDMTHVGVNLHEYILNTDPRMPDTDLDSYPDDGVNAWDMDEYIFYHTDPVDPDTDGDGMWDGWEIFYNLLPDNASDQYADPEADGLVNYLEFVHDTDPTMDDTDGDGMLDGWEVEYGLDPRSAADAATDVDDDMLTNLEEHGYGTNPRDPDTDRDMLTDYDEVQGIWFVTADGRTTSYSTDPTMADTDMDDQYDDEDGDGVYDPEEEVLDGIDNDGDSSVLQNNGIDDDRDGVVDDGRPGIPAVGLPEGVDEEHDLNDYNEVFVYRTNATNPDTDGEGLDDWYELNVDVHPDEEGMQRTSPVLSDTDSDRLSDKEEMDHTWLGSRNWHTDPLNPDTDADGLSDGDEVLEDFDPTTEDVRETCDPTNPDTDGDGMLDGFEFDYGDIDGDGLPTWWERENAGVYERAEYRRDANLDGVQDLLDDWDGDGLTNLMEYRYRLDPWDPLSGRDTYRERTSTPWPYLRRSPVYSDGDGDLMPDWWEVLTGLDPASPVDRWDDPDHDMLCNLDEYILDTDPHMADTDGDGEGDLFDHEVMCNPDFEDTDEDGIADWFERMHSDILDFTDPLDADRNDDGDNWTNYEEWIYAADPWHHVPTDPTMTSTDGDRLADDADPFPVYLPMTLRPLNPTREVQSVSPIRAYDSNGIPEAYGDMDQDGLNNSAEFARDVGHTDPTDPDTDGDGMPDGWEVVHAFWDPFTSKPNLDPLDPSDALEDPDWDGIGYRLRRDENGFWIIDEFDYNCDDYIDPVTENETLCNLEEYLFGEDPDRDGINEITSNPNRYDTDGDGIGDGWETLLNDHDGDGLSNWYELVYGLNPWDPVGENGTYGDPDEDGYSNLEEFLHMTHPRDPESYPGGGLGTTGGWLWSRRT